MLFSARSSKNRTICLLTTFLVLAFAGLPTRAQATRSTFIPYDNTWIGPPDYRWIALDPAHQQIFVAFTYLDRIDVLSSVDYHLVHSIPVPAPQSLDISPDGTTLAAGTLSAHILFFSTATFAKTNDVVFTGAAWGISAFVYTVNGNGFIRAEAGTSTGGGISAYWIAATNTFLYRPPNSSAGSPPYQYQYNGPLTRTGDYTQVILGDATTGGTVQVVDGATGDILEQVGLQGFILGIAANNNGSRYAACVAPAGIGQSFVILDGSLNLLYQDQAGCQTMAFSADGATVYRDALVGTTGVTQAFNATSFAVHNTTDNYASQLAYSGFWEAADSTGMVYAMTMIQPNVGRGMAFVAVDTTTSATPTINLYPIPGETTALVRIIDNIGSPQGGDLIRLLCTGVEKLSPANLQVTIGGVSASVQSISATTNLPSYSIVTVKTPSGAPGFDDVTLTADGTTSTVAKAFQYAASSRTFPFSTSPTWLLYDNLRQKLYASHGNQVEVIDPIAGQVLTPLVPASGKQQNSQFAALSLSPDNNRLYIADPGTNAIYMLDLTNPGTGATINPATALGSSSTISPLRAFETSTGSLVASDANSNPNIFTVDPATGSGSWIYDTLGNRINATAWSAVDQGQLIFTSQTGYSLARTADQIGYWNAVTSEFTPSADAEPGTGFSQTVYEGDANADGTVIATGLNSGLSGEDHQISGFDLFSVGYFEQHWDVQVPSGTSSLILHPTGALLYKAGSTPVGGSVEIDDLHQWQPTAFAIFPEPFVTGLPASYSATRALAVDSTGKYLFGITQSGITMMVLNTVPLSIGNLRPAIGEPAGGQTITVRGSGFQSGASVSIGGVQAITSFVDPDTLTVITPALASGYQDVTVINPGGATYTAPGLFLVTGSASQQLPAITGFSPAAITAETDIPGFDSPEPFTILGSGFDFSDTVEINGQPAVTSFTDSGHLQAYAPADLVGQTGALSVTVVSQVTGASNTLTLSVVNPAPMVDSVTPVNVVTGSSGVTVMILGQQFVPGSVIEWNGQPIPTEYSEGETGTGQQGVSSFVPASPFTTSGTVTLTVVNPAPGGGTSNSISLVISPAHPSVNYPASIDLGNVILSLSSTQSLQYLNVGTAPYTVTSITTSGSPFSFQAPGCPSIPAGNFCPIQVQFQPTVAGPAAGTLTITDNVTGSPHVIQLTGTGVTTLVPSVTLNFIADLDDTVSAYFNGTAAVGGPSVPATAWIEYSTDPALSTFSISPTWSFTGDQVVATNVSGFSAGTLYYARMAVQTAGGTGKSQIKPFATEAATPEVAFAFANGSTDSASVTPGQTATWQMLANDGGNGYIGTANLSCSGAPAGAVCSVAPSTLSIGMSATPFTVTVTTTGSSTNAALDPSRSDHWLWAFALLVGAWFLPRRSAWRRLHLLLLSATLAALVTSCGGGSSGGGSSPPPPTPTPAGTYTLTVTATTGGFNNPFILQLIVQ